MPKIGQICVFCLEYSKKLLFGRASTVKKFLNDYVFYTSIGTQPRAGSLKVIAEVRESKSPKTDKNLAKLDILILLLAEFFKTFSNLVLLLTIGKATYRVSVGYLMSLLSPWFSQCFKSYDSESIQIWFQIWTLINCTGQIFGWKEGLHLEGIRQHS